MKGKFDRIFVLVLSLLYNFVLLIIIFILIYGPGFTGPVGDTFGGIFSPIVGAISIYFIYETFKAQREQLDDQKKANIIQAEQLQEQRKQFIVDRITNIIYLQIQRVDANLKEQVFLVDGHSKSGVIGLYSLNLALEEEADSYEDTDLSDEECGYEKSIKIIKDNVDELTIFYNYVSNSLNIIRSNIKESSLLKNDIDELYRLFLLSLDDDLEDKIDRIFSILEDKFDEVHSPEYNSRITILEYVLLTIKDLISKTEVNTK